MGHYSDERGFSVGKIIIGADALVGADTLIPADVTIGNGARIRARSALLPHTRVAPGEYWAGTPARRVKI